MTTTFEKLDKCLDETYDLEAPYDTAEWFWLVTIIGRGIILALILIAEILDGDTE